MTYNRTPSRWHMEDGYEDSNDTELYPYRIFGTGKSASFAVVMRTFDQDMAAEQSKGTKSLSLVRMKSRKFGKKHFVFPQDDRLYLR